MAALTAFGVLLLLVAGTQAVYLPEQQSTSSPRELTIKTNSLFAPSQVIELGDRFDQLIHQWKDDKSCQCWFKPGLSMGDCLKDLSRPYMCKKFLFVYIYDGLLVATNVTPMNYTHADLGDQLDDFVQQWKGDKSCACNKHPGGTFGECMVEGRYECTKYTFMGIKGVVNILGKNPYGPRDISKWSKPSFTIAADVPRIPKSVNFKPYEFMEAVPELSHLSPGKSSSLFSLFGSSSKDLGDKLSDFLVQWKDDKTCACPSNPGASLSKCTSLLLQPFVCKKLAFVHLHGVLLIGPRPYGGDKSATTDLGDRLITFLKQSKDDKSCKCKSQSGVSFAECSDGSYDCAKYRFYQKLGGLAIAGVYPFEQPQQLTN